MLSNLILCLARAFGQTFACGLADSPVAFSGATGRVPLGVSPVGSALCLGLRVGEVFRGVVEGATEVSGLTWAVAVGFSL